MGKKFKGAAIQPQIQMESGEVRHFNTYRELKTKLREAIIDNGYEAVFVVRSRRGQWGEWTEWWKIENGIPTIIKEGWS